MRRLPCRPLFVQQSAKPGSEKHPEKPTGIRKSEVVRYVPTDEVDELQKAIDGYTLFRELAEQYAEEIVRATRKERDKKKQDRKGG
jgi:hypothetical protein